MLKGSVPLVRHLARGRHHRHLQPRRLRQERRQRQGRTTTRHGRPAASAWRPRRTAICSSASPPTARWTTPIHARATATRRPRRPRTASRWPTCSTPAPTCTQVNGHDQEVINQRRLAADRLHHQPRPCRSSRSPRTAARHLRADRLRLDQRAALGSTDHLPRQAGQPGIPVHLHGRTPAGRGRGVFHEGQRLQRIRRAATTPPAACRSTRSTTSTPRPTPLSPT